MNLNDVQKKQIAIWVKEGLSLNDIQKKIENEFHTKITYMDLRLLVIDIGAEYEEPKEDNQEESQQNDSTENKIEEHQNEEVVVEIDKLARPGVLISGSVIFSDGVKASWMLDRAGRVGLEASQPDYKPSEEDLMQFQLKLQELLKNNSL